LIKDSFKPLFNEYLIPSLQEKGIKNLILLEGIISDVLEQIRRDHPNRNDIPKSITCSKHWWYDYLKENEELKDLWDSFLLEKQLNVKKGKKMRSHKTRQFSAKSQPDTTSMLEETPETQAATPSQDYWFNELVDYDHPILQKEFSFQEPCFTMKPSLETTPE